MQNYNKIAFQKGGLRWQTISEMPAIISNHRFFSVDVFDTLLFRLCRSPRDVFRFIENRPEVTGKIRYFSDYRIAAEQQAREDASKNNREDVTLDEIYNCLEEMANCPKETTRYLKRVELETEAALLQPTVFGQSLIRHIRDTNKRLLLTSDMYLPQGFVEAVLEAREITGWERLLLSNVQGKTKHSGTLFDDVIKHFEVPPDQILHIGDNPHADGTMAERAGLREHVLPASRSLPAKSRTTRRHSHIFNGEGPLSQIFAARFLEAHFDGKPKLDLNAISDDAYFDAFGAVVVAPVMLSMMLWLKSEMDRHGLRRIVFLARDGMFPKTLFDMLWPEKYETEYAAASRRLLSLPFGELDERLIHSMFRATLNGAVRLQDFLEMIAAGEGLKSLLERNGFDIDEPLTRRSRKQVLKLLKDNPALISAAFANERKVTTSYYRQMFPAGTRNALFDVGWRGSLQRSICDIVDPTAQVTGFYFGTDRNANTLLRRHGLSYESYSVHNGLPAAKAKWVSDFRYVVEFLFSADHGGVLRLSEMENGTHKWHLAKVNQEEQANLLISKRIQNAALEAIDAITKALPMDFIETLASDKDEEDFLKFLAQPHRLDARRFKNVKIFPGVGDGAGESLTRIGARGSHYRNVKNSSWRTAYGAQLGPISKALVNHRLGRRKLKNLRI